MSMTEKIVPKKEIILCKFDPDIECDTYICEEDVNVLDELIDSGKQCKMFVAYQELLSEKLLAKIKPIKRAK